MNAFNLKGLAAWLMDKGLMDKRFCDMSREEIEAVCEEVHHATDPVSGYVPPYLDDNCQLVIPCCAPAKYKYWQGGQSLRATLEEIGAPEDIIKRYNYATPGGM